MGREEFLKSLSEKSYTDKMNNSRRNNKELATRGSRGIVTTGRKELATKGKKELATKGRREIAQSKRLERYTAAVPLSEINKRNARARLKQREHIEQGKKRMITGFLATLLAAGAIGIGVDSIKRGEEGANISQALDSGMSLEELGMNEEKMNEYKELLARTAQIDLTAEQQEELANDIYNFERSLVKNKISEALNSVGVSKINGEKVTTSDITLVQGNSNVNIVNIEDLGAFGSGGLLSKKSISKDIIDYINEVAYMQQIEYDIQDGKYPLFKYTEPEGLQKVFNERLKETGEFAAVKVTFVPVGKNGEGYFETEKMNKEKYYAAKEEQAKQEKQEKDFER